MAGRGLALPVVARRLAAAGWRGFEWAVGVPGSLGGAVRMNAGGHGSDMASCLVAAHVFDVAGGTAAWRTVDELGLALPGLRSHCPRRRGRGADCASRPATERRPRRRSPRSCSWRRENQPGGQNAGSVFVNPVPGEVSAGLLIDGLGLRGLRVGTAWVSEKHANFIQASDGGSAHDVRAVIELVRAACRRGDRRRAAQRGSSRRLRGRAMSEPDANRNPRRTAAGDAPPAPRRAARCSTSCEPRAVRQHRRRRAAEPAGGDVSPSIIAESLVPEATRRSQRRSRREAKREAKQEAKRVAANREGGQAAAKQARKAAEEGSDSQPDVDVRRAGGLDDGSERPDHLRAGDGPPRAPDGGQAGRPASSADDRHRRRRIARPVYVEGDLGQRRQRHRARRRRPAIDRVHRRPRSRHRRDRHRSTWRRRRRAWNRGCASDASPSNGPSGAGD